MKLVSGVEVCVSHSYYKVHMVCCLFYKLTTKINCELEMTQCK